MRKASILLIAAAALLTASPVRGMSDRFVGRWFGAVQKADGQTIPTVVEIMKAGDSLVIKRTQINHGVLSEPIVNWQADDAGITLIPLTNSKNATWIGQISDDESWFGGDVVEDDQVLGTFRLKRTPVVSREPAAQSWLGSARMPGRDFEVVRITLAHGENGWVGDVALPDRHIADHPTTVEETADGLRLMVPSDPVIELELLSPTPLNDGPTADMIGVWREGDTAASLMLSRIPPGTAPGMLRPQQPRGNVPYQVRHQDLTHPLGHRLGVTLFLPAGEGPHPGVVLIFGDGDIGRNGVEQGHEFTHVWADLLARSGIASVRFDGRGIGRSTMPAGRTQSDMSLDDAGSDVRYLIEWLRGQSDIDQHATGLIGWGDGGLVAISVTPGLSSEVQFLVLLSTAGVPVSDFLKWEMSRMLERIGVDETRKQSIAITHATVLNVAKDPEASVDEIRGVIGPFQEAQIALSPEGRSVTEASIDRDLHKFAAPGFRENLRFDPGQYLPRVRCPILAVGGAADMVVPRPLGLDRLAAAAARTGLDIEIVELPLLNHRLQPVDPEQPDLPAYIRATVDPTAVQLVTNWIRSRFPHGREARP